MNERSTQGYQPKQSDQRSAEQVPSCGSAVEDQGKVPIWHKSCLTIKEAAEYSGIGETRLREILQTHGKQLVLFNNSKRLVKRQALDKLIEESQYL